MFHSNSGPSGKPTCLAGMFQLQQQHSNTTWILQASRERQRHFQVVCLSHSVRKSIYQPDVGLGQDIKAKQQGGEVTRTERLIDQAYFKDVEMPHMNQNSLTIHFFIDLQGTISVFSITQLFFDKHHIHTDWETHFFMQTHNTDANRWRDTV